MFYIRDWLNQTTLGMIMACFCTEGLLCFIAAFGLWLVLSHVPSRAHVEAGGGAWCPREMVYHEGLQYLEVNLGALHVVTKVEVQGRFGNGQGREFTTQFKLQIWRPNMAHWATYKDGRGKEVGCVHHCQGGYVIQCMVQCRAVNFQFETLS